VSFPEELEEFAGKGSMRSELFTLITFELAGRRNWREGGHLPIIRARKQKVTGDLRKCVGICGSLAVLHGSFCDRARRGREFQEGSARFVKFTVVSASKKRSTFVSSRATWRCTRA